MGIKKIAFTMYVVKDMPRARAFYGKTLGLKETANYADGWVEYDLPGGCFAITNMVESRRPSHEGSGTIAFEVDNADEETDRLRKLGVTVAMEPYSTPVCRMAVVLDSEGNRVMIHQVPDV
jgi:predicted enzyme related to lactoylglutathione lyase